MAPEHSTANTRVPRPTSTNAPPTSYDDATPTSLAALMRERLHSRPSYGPVEAGGAARAASLIAPLLT